MANKIRTTKEAGADTFACQICVNAACVNCHRERQLIVTVSSFLQAISRTYRVFCKECRARIFA